MFSCNWLLRKARDHHPDRFDISDNLDDVRLRRGQQVRYDQRSHLEGPYQWWLQIRQAAQINGRQHQTKQAGQGECAGVEERTLLD
jgi:hypothetical protein